MKSGKLLTLGVIGALTWEHQAMLGERLAWAANAVQIAQCYIDLAQYGGALAKDMRDNGAPANVAAWIRANFTKPGGRDAAADPFGTPYELDYDRRTRVYELRGCGPDRRCGTSDDMTQRLP